MTKTVETFYDSYVEREWARAERHPIEFATTWMAMQEYIPAGSTILDVGGGPGRYSIRLAQAGHRVTLLDLSSANVAFARAKAAELGAPVADFVHGNAVDLGCIGEQQTQSATSLGCTQSATSQSRFADASFDVVLLMGPLYHLVAAEDRDQAVREALRVLKPGGVLFAAFITRYAFLVDLLKYEPEVIGEYESRLDQLLSTGVSMVSDENPGFTDAHFAHPMEIEPLMSSYGLKALRLAAAEGVVGTVEPRLLELSGEIVDKWAGVCYRLGTDPLTWGTAEHMLYVGRKA